MKLLILGGTQFVGRHLTEAALAGGHEVTLFNRGKSGPDVFPQVETLLGNRDGGLDALRGRRWDAVIDTCGYVPRIVEASASLLADQTDLYAFISSISVYPDLSTPGLTEETPTGTLDDPKTEEVTGETYGPLKVLCEQAAEAQMPGRVLTIRPGLIVGPYDPTDRFTYWIHRVTQGGQILAPGDPDQRLQWIDARDLAEWTIRALGANTTGIFNAVSADTSWTMRRLLEETKTASRSDAELVWVSEEFLRDEGVAPWSDLPLWVPQTITEEYHGFNHVSAAKAVMAGLTFRPLAETIRDTLAWDQTRPADHQIRAGISREREQEVLAAWHAASSA